MMKKYSLAFHDLKVSENKITIKKINTVLKKFKVPLTIHLIIDGQIKKNSELYYFLLKKINNGEIDIVFHGLAHKCSYKTAAYLSFYHKYQAEYLCESEELRINTEKMFYGLSVIFKKNFGICPPCWLASKNNYSFFKKLKPLFIESLFYISYLNKNVFSPVISLGSSDRKELFFLKKIGKIIFYVSLFLKKNFIRVAIHDCDLTAFDSLDFLYKITQSLHKKDFLPVLMRHLL